MIAIQKAEKYFNTPLCPTVQGRFICPWPYWQSKPSVNVGSKASVPIKIDNISLTAG
jgi:hypothetical protein